MSRAQKVSEPVEASAEPELGEVAVGLAHGRALPEQVGGGEIVVGDVVIRAGADADEGQLTRAIRAARAAAS